MTERPDQPALDDASLERLAPEAAAVVVDVFEEYHERFRSLTRKAGRRFARRDWIGLRRDTRERFRCQPLGLDRAVAELQALFGDAVGQPTVWRRLKVAYAEAILGRDDFELAQTFFNSLTRRIFSQVGLDPETLFVSADFPLPYGGWEMTAARAYSTRTVTPAVVRRIFRDIELPIRLADESQTVERVAEALQTGVDAHFAGPIDAVDILRPLFLRNKAAYLVGRARRGKHVQPLTLALLHGDDGLEVDAVLQTEDAVSIVFSFARWYFHVDVETPRAVIGFLHSILPRKRISELYISLGYWKHGKTELVNDLVQHVARTSERFHRAPGQVGMVMSVFTLPSFEFVFKVIKDDFPPAKAVTRAEVRDKYRLVLLHDRVGRLIDYQELEDLALPRERFGEDMLEELRTLASRSVEIDGDRVLLKHFYVGRRVEPLDLHVHRRSVAEARNAIIDWGWAIKDLAVANLFAGDMLMKNFGVTRHGRVVFYDYDELRPLTECRFRRIPEPRDPYEAMSDQPWYSVEERDVFPEELHAFLGLRGEAREIFTQHHADLFEVDFWRDAQEHQRGGELVDFFPYARWTRPRD